MENEKCKGCKCCDNGGLCCALCKPEIGCLCKSDCKNCPAYVDRDPRRGRFRDQPPEVGALITTIIVFLIVGLFMITYLIFLTSMDGPAPSAEVDASSIYIEGECR